MRTDREGIVAEFEEPTTTERIELANGLRVLVEFVPGVRTASVGLWIETGSRDEPEPWQGISHFLEHAVFKGTRKRRTHQIAQYLESVGGYVNAFTTKDHTCFYARLLDAHLERAVDLLADLALHPTFPEREVARERQVILEEMHLYEDTPDELALDLFDEVLFEGHPLAHPIVGRPDTVSALGPEELHAYKARQYRPGRMILTFAGPFCLSKVLPLVERYFGEADNAGPAPLERLPVNGYNPYWRERTRAIGQAHLVMGTRAPGMRDAEQHALAVLAALLGGGMSSILNQRIRERYGFCYAIYAFYHGWSDVGQFGIYAGVEAAKLERLIKLIWQELDRLRQAPPKARLLEQAKAQLKGSLWMGLEGTQARMMRLGKDELYYRRPVPLSEVLAGIEAVTPEAVQRLAQELFREERFSGVLLKPE
ncbi:MAG: insulinase family protein [Bacteroidetes bacterium]|nr:insulinase family protein [Bacteroidota bacterium]MCX7907011.1 insulinase family protein [Bacteroidota bacterium]MDW8137625.1 pitrilysin family protein [Bacteroidota bacterium]MDW8285421.1 pitrilysin family protein [Bacteroidota bacterium]